MSDEDLLPKVKNLANKAFEVANGNHRLATSEAYKSVRGACPGEWIVIVGSRGRLDKDKFCAVFDKFSKYSFYGKYKKGGPDDKVSHEIIISAPGIDEASNA
jgi:hypothetical protein